MPIIDLADAKRHLNITSAADDLLIADKIEAAQAMVESLLGYAIADRFETVPGDLKEAVRQMVAHLYENRESTIVAISAGMLPLGMADIVRNRRDWTFTDGA